MINLELKLIQNNLCISVDALANTIQKPFEVALNAIKKGLERHRNGYDSWQHFEDESDRRKKWIVLDSIPEDTRLHVEYIIQDPWLVYYTQLMTLEVFQDISAKDKAYFQEIKIKAGQIGFTKDQANDLAEACSWLRFVNSGWYNNKFSGKVEFYNWAAKVIKQRNLYGFKVGSAKTLRKKVKEWNSRGRESLIPGYVGNNNAQKITNEAEQYIIYLYSQPEKLSLRDVTKIHNDLAQENNWNELSEERIRQVLFKSKNKQLWYPKRHGIEAFRNESERTIKRRRPSFADALWTMDGTSLQLLYIDEKGRLRSDLYVYAVADAFSQALIGYALGETEDARLVQRALRDACKKTGMLPYQVQYDNSSANKGGEVQQLLTKLTRHHTPTAPYNGKSKVIESIFGRIEQRFMRLFPNFKGGNITAPSLNSKANPDYIKQQLKDKTLPTKDLVIEQIELIIELYNNSKNGKGQIINELYRTPHEKRKEIEFHQMIDLFWVKRRKQASYTKNGLTIEIKTRGVAERYTYEVENERGIEDREFRRQYLGSKFDIMYDPYDLEYINLYKDGAWVATARQKYETPMALADMEEGDGQIIARAQTQRKDYIAEQYETMEELEGQIIENGYPVFSPQLLRKDEYNRIENEILLNRVSQIGQVIEIEKKPRKQRYSLYKDDADGSRIE